MISCLKWPFLLFSLYIILWSILQTIHLGNFSKRKFSNTFIKVDKCMPYCQANFLQSTNNFQITTSFINPLIDHYGKNDLKLAGEYGRGVVLVGHEKSNASKSVAEFRVNIFISDMIPLNRMVPDSRPQGCSLINYTKDLSTASVIITFHNEWPSILLRTIYSIINRTPRHLLKEIILIDDASTLEYFQKSLSDYIRIHFPSGLVNLKRTSQREGLIKARNTGWRQATGDVLVFLDSHMEVNINWLEPLLQTIKENKQTLVLSVLDYINRETFAYIFNGDMGPLYYFNWRLEFFEAYHRPDQLYPEHVRPIPGVVSVGTGHAIERKFFEEIGAYDDEMQIWGGENLELAWKTWMCGGQVLHVPCSRIGHIARPQPYSFPEGRMNSLLRNYKRAVDVWMEPEIRKFVYTQYPEFRGIDAGDLTSKVKLKEKLKCKNFTWFIDNIFPELTVFDRGALAWGLIKSVWNGKCLDSHNSWGRNLEPVSLELCKSHVALHQTFSWTNKRLIRSSFKCLLFQSNDVGLYSDDCVFGAKDKWSHQKNGNIVNDASGLCLEATKDGKLISGACNPKQLSQKWFFANYKL